MISNISRSSRTNVGGLESLQAIPISEVTDVSRPIGQKVSITLASGKAFRTIYTTFGTRKYQDNAAPNGRKQAHEIIVTGSVPATDETTLTQLAKYQNEGFVLKVKDNNGRLRLIGSLSEPVWFSYNDGTGSTPEDWNGCDFKFYRTMRQSPPFIDS